MFLKRLFEVFCLGAGVAAANTAIMPVVMAKVGKPELIPMVSGGVSAVTAVMVGECFRTVKNGKKTEKKERDEPDLEA